MLEHRRVVDVFLAGPAYNRSASTRMKRRDELAAREETGAHVSKLRSWMSDAQREAELFWRFNAGVSVRLAASIVGISFCALGMAVSRGGDAYLTVAKLRSPEQQETVEQRLAPLAALLPKTEFL